MLYYYNIIHLLEHTKKSKQGHRAAICVKTQYKTTLLQGRYKAEWEKRRMLWDLSSNL